MKLRTDLINFFIEAFGYTSYLEVGVKGEQKNFVHIKCERKEGIDPNGCTTHKMTSDEYFDTVGRDIKWDLIFIDGLHERAQVKRDIENALLHLNENGTIVCHDVNPRESWLLGEAYCWNAWEAFAELRTERDDIEMHGVTFDHAGFIRKGSQEIWTKPVQYSWEYLQANRSRLMQELTPEQLIEKYK